MVSPARTQVGHWLNELFLIEQDVRLHLEAFNEAQLNWRPGPGRWSIAECLDHLAITTTLMLEEVRPAIERAKAEGRKGGDGPYQYGMIGGWFVRMMETPGKRPMPAPRNFVPASGWSKSAVLGKFAGAMREFRGALESARGTALDQISAKSSAQGSRWIRLNVAAWFAASLVARPPARGPGRAGPRRDRVPLRGRSPTSRLRTALSSLSLSAESRPMKCVLSLAVITCLTIPAALPAQDQPGAIASAMKATITRFARNMPGAADSMPADKYGFKPSPAQMSFGEILAHEAESNETLCAAISGSAATPSESAAGATAPKADLVARLRKSFDYCGTVVGAIQDAQLGDSVPFFGGRKATRARAVIALAQDWADHYAQAAMYLRANGILPPSARPRP